MGFAGGLGDLCIGAFSECFRSLILILFRSADLGWTYLRADSGSGFRGQLFELGLCLVYLYSHWQE